MYLLTEEKSLYLSVHEFLCYITYMPCDKHFTSLGNPYGVNCRSTNDWELECPVHWLKIFGVMVPAGVKRKVILHDATEWSQGSFFRRWYIWCMVMLYVHYTLLCHWPCTRLAWIICISFLRNNYQLWTIVVYMLIVLHEYAESGRLRCDVIGVLMIFTSLGRDAGNQVILVPSQYCK